MAKVAETLEWGYALLDNGNVVSPNGDVISQEAYAELAKRRQSQADWTEVPDDELGDMLERAEFVVNLGTRTNARGAFRQETSTYAFVDVEGNPWLARIDEFEGAQHSSILETDWGLWIWFVKRDRPEILPTVSDKLEELFGTTEQVGSEFVPPYSEVDRTYKIKKFVRGNELWKVQWLNGELHSVAKVGELTRQVEVGSHPEHAKDIVSRAVAQGKFI